MSKLLTALAIPLSLAACADDPIKQPDVLALPGPAYFPESVHADADGTLYVGSLATGQIVAYDNGDEAPRTIVAAGANGVTGVTGVHVHGDELWACKVDTMTFATELRSFALDGTPKATYPFPANHFCNDIDFDAAGNAYATDSFSGTIQRLPKGGAALETWLQDARFTPDSMGAFGLDGIAITGDTLYLNKLDTGELFAISIATKAITPITVTPALIAPDGMRAVNNKTLLVIEGNEAARLSKVTVSGSTATTSSLASGLDQPTAVVEARGSAWVTEGQLGRLFTGMAPNTPFAVRRIAL